MNARAKIKVRSYSKSARTVSNRAARRSLREEEVTDEDLDYRPGE